jgi:transposase
MEVGTLVFLRKNQTRCPAHYSEMTNGNGSKSYSLAKDNRLFIEAVLRIARTGSPWRDLAPALGSWHATYTRFSRWGKKGVWQRIIAAVRTDADLEALLIDSTVVHAHQHAAGAQKKTARKHSGACGAA